MGDAVIRAVGTGLTQRGIRAHNERLVLTLLQRHGALPASELARRSGLSPPTVSAILRGLEAEGLVERGAPQRGRVGKPSVPMRVAAGGAFAHGLKIGRRSADLLLIDLEGEVRLRDRVTYASPRPEEVFRFLADGLGRQGAALAPAEARRVCGVGVAAPFELWSGQDGPTGTAATFPGWEAVDLRAEVARLSGLPVSLMNDATAACRAEQVYGRGREFTDYAYFFVGAYVGGGIVLNHSVFEGRQGNAGALGSLRSVGPTGEALQLVDTASIHLLERRLREADLDPAIVWTAPQDWTPIMRHVEPWLGRTAQELARAALSTCSVIDFEAVLIDGAFPAAIRDALVARVQRYLRNQDLRGLIPPRIEAGSIGADARGIGAACAPILAQFLLDANAGAASA